MNPSLKFFLITVILFCLTFEVVRFYEYVNDFSNWQYADWLINYQGGFVRRGFIGNILYLIHKFFKINLDLIIFIFVTSIYFFISYFLLKSLKYLENNKENLLIFLSPGFFIYPIMNSGIIGRKDILLIFCVIFFVYFEKKISNKYIFLSFLIALIILCFSHSGFVFYSQYLFFLFILIKHNRSLRINKVEFFSFWFLVFLIMLLINYIGGDQSTVENICLSVKEFASQECGKSDQIMHLNDANTGIYQRLYEKINLGPKYLLNYFIIYSISIFVVFFFISKKLINSRLSISLFEFQLRKPFKIFLILFILTLPVFVIGRDWGRYIYISYSCIFFIYIYCIKEKLIIINSNNFKFINNKLFLIIFIFFYSFSFTFPYYDAKSFKVILQKPIVNVMKKIN